MSYILSVVCCHVEVFVFLYDGLISHPEES